MSVQSGVQSAEAPIRIVIADDQTAVREGLGLLLGLLPDIDVVAQVGDGDAAIEAVARHAPQVVLMDLHMPRRDGIEATKAIRADHPNVQVVILTTYDDDASILHALQAGALGFLTKDATQAEIGRALAALPRARPSSTRPCRPACWPRPPAAHCCHRTRAA